jgi:hypothetical protein
MMYKEDYYFADQFPAGREAHMNFADELACLTAYIFRMK